MNGKLIATFVVLCSTAGATPSLAAIDAAKGWQIHSLKGVTAISYGVAYDPSKELIKTVTSSLTGLNVPAKAIEFKDQGDSNLSTTEARLKVFVDNREKDQCWVGLSVEQKAQLARESSITFDSKTYSVGTLSARSKTNESIKEVCARFVEDFNNQVKKSK